MKPKNLKRERKKRALSVKFAVNQQEWDDWHAKADEAGFSFSEWCRRRCGGRPMNDRKPKVRAEVESPSDLAEMEAAEREEMEQLEEQNAALRAAQQREYKARQAAAACGGVEAWFASLEPQEREGWADLKEKLLAGERLTRESEERWKKDFGVTPAEFMAPKPRPRFLRRGDEASGLTITDGGLILD